MEYLVFTYALIFISGLFFGTFANVCIKRWHDETPLFCAPTCDTCGHKIPWCDTVPVLSFILNKGKCGYCHTPIPLQNLVVELVTGFTFLAIFTSYGFSLEGIKMLLVAWMFIVGTVSDINYREVPNELTLIALIAMPTFILLNVNSLLNTLWGVIPAIWIVLFACIVAHFTGQEDIIGGGDVKFMFSVGGLMGMEFVLLMFVLGCISLALMYGSFIIESAITKGAKGTSVPMLVGFSQAYTLMLLMHYLADARFDVFGGFLP